MKSNYTELYENDKKTLSSDIGKNLKEDADKDLLLIGFSMRQGMKYLISTFIISSRNNPLINVIDRRYLGYQ